MKTKIEPIDDFIELAVRETLSPQARSRAIAEFAHGRVQQAEEANQRILGRVPPQKRFVDGREGAAFEEVNPDRGVIVVEFEMVTDVLRWVGGELVRRSPVLSGDYKDAHTLFADGKEVELGGAIPPANEYSFTNLEPYARKVEIGKTQDGRDFLIQVEPRIYERTARDARSRYGNIVKIEFTYRGVVGLSSGAGTQINPLRDPTRANSRARSRSGRFESSGGPKAYNVSSVRYPTIVISLR